MKNFCSLRAPPSIAGIRAHRGAPVPSAGAHVDAPVVRERHALGYKLRAAQLRVAAARYRAVAHHDALPRQIVGAAAHRPADLARRARSAEHIGYLPVADDAAARYRAHDFVDALEKRRALRARG